LSNEWILNNKISGIKLVFFSLRNYKDDARSNKHKIIYSYSYGHVGYARWQWLVMIIYSHEAFVWHLYFGQYCNTDPCRLKRFTYVAILILPILGAFEKLRKATFSFVMFVCPSAQNNTAPAEPIFTKFGTVYFSKFFQENSSFIKIWHE